MGALPVSAHDRKKKRERAHLERLLECCPHLPQGQIALGNDDGSEPDFFNNVAGDKIGIEHTELFVARPCGARRQAANRGNEMKEQEQLRRLIMKRAMTIHSEAGGFPLRVDVEFAATNFRKSDVEPAARIMADYVPKRLRASRTGVFWRERTRRDRLWPKWLWFLRIRCVAESHWDVGLEGSVYPADSSVERALLKKERSYTRYRSSNCSEYWLLLVIEGFAPSSFISPPSADRVFTTSFNRVFLLRVRDGSVMELRTRRQGSH